MGTLLILVAVLVVVPFIQKAVLLKNSLTNVHLYKIPDLGQFSKLIMAIAQYSQIQYFMITMVQKYILSA